GLTLEKRLFDRWSASLEIFYAFVGSPPGLRLSDAVGLTAGVAYRPLPALAVSVFLDAETRVGPKQDTPVDLRLQAEYAIAKTVRVVGSVIRGFTDASPRWGATAGVVFDF